MHAGVQVGMQAGEATKVGRSSLSVCVGESANFHPLCEELL